MRWSRRATPLAAAIQQRDPSVTRGTAHAECGDRGAGVLWIWLGVRSGWGLACRARGAPWAHFRIAGHHKHWREPADRQRPLSKRSSRQLRSCAGHGRTLSHPAQSLPAPLIGTEGQAPSGHGILRRSRPARCRLASESRSLTYSVPKEVPGRQGNRAHGSEGLPPDLRGCVFLCGVGCVPQLVMRGRTCRGASGCLGGFGDPARLPRLWYSRVLGMVG